MRLTQSEIEAIKQTFLDVFHDGEIYLFGSRVDDNQKGGDIDLFIDRPINASFRKKIEFLSLLKQKIGDQKIDVVLSRDKKRLIEREALQKGIKLC